MSFQRDFHYRIPMRVGGQRPGAHRSSTTGSGQEFIAHQTLFDRPDPRRLDLRASIRDPEGRWLVRVNRQRAGIPVYLMADVSASMAFGSSDTKLARLAQFALSLGDSVFRTGDALGMLGYDSRERTDLMLAPMHSRGAGVMMAEALGRVRADQGSTDGILEACARIAGKQALVFIASDFHAPLAQTSAALDLLSHAYVVPMVIWDAAEPRAPDGEGLLALRDIETGRRRGLWLRPQIRRRWEDAFAQRREALDKMFSARGTRPFYMTGRFDADALSRYFFEAV